jgi:hypothetical protein
MKMKARNHLPQGHPYAESKTALQWVKERRIVNTDATGETFWPNANHSRPVVYYRPEDTHEATEMELDEERAKAQERKNKSHRKKTGIWPN